MHGRKMICPGSSTMPRKERRWSLSASPRALMPFWASNGLVASRQARFQSRRLITELSAPPGTVRLTVPASCRGFLPDRIPAAAGRSWRSSRAPLLMRVPLPCEEEASPSPPRVS